MPDLKSLALFLMNEECYNSLLVQGEANTLCLSLVVSKMLGYLILAGSFMLKVPQIVSIMRAQSADSVSSAMYYLDSLVLIIGASYGLRTLMAFSTYGESYFLMLQNLIILFQIHFYEKRLGGFSLKFILFAALALYFSGAAGDLMPSLPMPYLALLQSTLPIPVGALSRPPQTYRLHKSGRPG